MKKTSAAMMVLCTALLAGCQTGRVVVDPEGTIAPIPGTKQDVITPLDMSALTENSQLATTAPKVAFKFDNGGLSRVW